MSLGEQRNSTTELKNRMQTLVEGFGPHLDNLTTLLNNTSVQTNDLIQVKSEIHQAVSHYSGLHAALLTFSPFHQG